MTNKNCGKKRYKTKKMAQKNNLIYKIKVYKSFFPEKYKTKRLKILHV